MSDQENDELSVSVEGYKSYTVSGPKIGWQVIGDFISVTSDGKVVDWFAKDKVVNIGLVPHRKVAPEPEPGKESSRKGVIVFFVIWTAVVVTGMSFLI